MGQVGGSSLATVLRQAEQGLWLEFERSGIFKHRGLVGTGRENALIEFLRAQLPSRFAVASGEVVDLGGRRSGQTDVLIYDAQAAAPLVIKGDGTVLLGAEALLATIEVKSTLTRSETVKALGGIEKIQTLRPWGQHWARYRGRRKSADDGPRFFSTILAFDTDHGGTDWPAKELRRVRDECDKLDIPFEHVDRVAVLEHGVVMPADGRVATSELPMSSLGLWYTSLLHFLGREVERRPAFPWPDYDSWEGRKWQSPEGPVFRAPKPVQYSKTQVGKYRRKGQER